MKDSGSTLIIVFRMLFFGLIGGLGNYLLETGSPSWLAAGAAMAGVLAGFLLARTHITFLSFLCIGGVCHGAFQLMLYALETASPLITAESFAAYTLGQHVLVFELWAASCALLAWFFCRVPGFATIEVIGFLAGCILFLSSHRNFHFESPKLFNSIAWSLGLTPLVIFIIAGLVTSLAAISYVYGTIWYHPKGSPQEAFLGPKRLMRTPLLFLAFAALLYGICSLIYSSLYSIQLVRTANGVGQERSPGMSPLGFHSALGSTNQPAALVRLDGDYQQNPFTPMLYLRENALSQYNGKEIVMADRIYDRDVTATAPDENFLGDEDPTLANRTKLSLSAYLLADHNSAFAVDYPIAINPIKNPNPQRFKNAFKAVSLVPQFKLEDLSMVQVGDSRWNDAAWQHYMETNIDPRYKALAEKITIGQMTNVQKAMAIVEYLSATAIYTLTPNHSIPPDGDPVVPFLFGDMRGYCVHFSHATVYMLRALGIPARIGTGYLTDLSQARDGHILLRMSDRHAWAEVYLEGFGWVPFDTKPQQVESHAETKVDMKLLEELMGMLGNDEIILPKDIAIDEPGTKEPLSDLHIPLPNLTPYMLSLLALLCVAKCWLRYSWLLPASTQKKLYRAYRAVISYCHDLGMLRELGETKREYQERVSSQLGIPILQITPAVIEKQYGASSRITNHELRDAMNLEHAALRDLSFGHKVLAFLNPMSVFTLLRQPW